MTLATAPGCPAGWMSMFSSLTPLTGRVIDGVSQQLEMMELIPLLTCTRVQVKNDGLWLVKPRNVVPARGADACTIGCEFSNRQCLPELVDGERLTPAGPEAPFKVLESQVDDPGAVIAWVGWFGTLVLIVIATQNKHSGNTSSYQTYF